MVDALRREMDFRRVGITAPRQNNEQHDKARLPKSVSFPTPGLVVIPYPPHQTPGKKVPYAKNGGAFSSLPWTFEATWGRVVDNKSERQGCFAPFLSPPGVSMTLLKWGHDSFLLGTDPIFKGSRKGDSH